MPTATRSAHKAAASKHVHRDLRQGDRGVDVRQFQIGINRTARHWKLERFEVEVDGVRGPKTLAAAEHLLYAMGAHGRVMTRARQGVLTEYAQRLLRGTRKRTKTMAALSKARRPKVRKWRLSLGERAFRIAESLVGVMEHGGNNTGPMVDKIIQSNGGYIGEPWCGDFVAYCYRLAGSKLVSRLWASVYYLGQVVGLTTTSSPKRGDIVRYDFDHTGLFGRWLKAGESIPGYGTVPGPRYFLAIEGNTGNSGAVSDSVTGGDGVKEKVRHSSQVANFRRVNH